MGAGWGGDSLETRHRSTPTWVTLGAATFSLSRSGSLLPRSSRCSHRKWDHSFPAPCTEPSSPFYQNQAALKGLEGGRRRVLWALPARGAPDRQTVHGLRPGLELLPQVKCQSDTGSWERNISRWVRRTGRHLFLRHVTSRAGLCRLPSSSPSQQALLPATLL